MHRAAAASRHGELNYFTVGSVFTVWKKRLMCGRSKCWGDVGSILLHHGGNTTASGHDDTVFDFGTLHYCRNFESIVEWTRENGVKSVTMDNLWWGGSRDI